MRKLILICVGVMCMFSLHAQDKVQADSAYAAEKYEEAIPIYMALLKEGEHADIYYNLGNCYYKTDRLALAILNYERSLLLDSDNADTRFNLEMAQARIADKIEPLGTFFLVQWSTAVRNLFPSNVWAVIAVVAFLLFLVGVVLYFFVEKVVLRKIGFFAGLLAVLVAIGANHFASEQKARIIHRDSAIIFAPTITVKSSPSESGTDLFVLHEGTKVYLMDRVGEWSEIRLEDGNRGWIPTDKLEII